MNFESFDNFKVTYLLQNCPPFFAVVIYNRDSFSRVQEKWLIHQFLWLLSPFLGKPYHHYKRGVAEELTTHQGEKSLQSQKTNFKKVKKSEQKSLLWGCKTPKFGYF